MKEFSLIAVAVFLVLGLSGLGSQLDGNVAGQAVANTDYDSVGTAGVYEVVEEESNPNFLSKLLAKDASVKKKFQIAEGRCTQDSHCDGLETCEYSYCIDLTGSTADKTGGTQEQCDEIRDSIDQYMAARDACGEENGVSPGDSFTDEFYDNCYGLQAAVFDLVDAYQNCGEEESNPLPDDTAVDSGDTTDTSSEGGSEDPDAGDSDDDDTGEEDDGMDDDA